MAVTSVQEIFDMMGSRPLPEQAADINATIQFDLSGEGGGQWYVTASGGQATASAGTAPNPNLTLSASAADYLALFNGQLNPMNAFMQGKLRIKGDMALAMRLQKLFGG
jgi:putative sterol carrier protein